jgi:pre-mRNA-splicing factor SYF1
MYTIYIAKAAELYGLPATRAIYERALDSETARLPDAATAELCLRFAALERKLGEIDRARAVFAHASQFCDPRVHPRFWTEWNAFEIATGSEDTFREMLRIKRSVQAQFNTETSYLVAQANAVAKGQVIAQPTAEAHLDPMAAAEKQAGAARGPAFVSAKKTEGPRGEEDADIPPEASELQANDDEIHISDDDKDS